MTAFRLIQFIFISEYFNIHGDGSLRICQSSIFRDIPRAHNMDRFDMSKYRPICVQMTTSSRRCNPELEDMYVCLIPFFQFYLTAL
jgi:hypothetical protein